MISSKNFPSPYPDFTDCVWFIMVKEGMKLEINFLTFDLPLSQKKRCIDYLRIRSYGESHVNYTDYINDNDESSTLPPKFISNGNLVEIIFRSGQNKDHNSGFLLKYFTYKESKDSTASTEKSKAFSLNGVGM